MTCTEISTSVQDDILTEFLDERIHQIRDKGFDAEHDDNHKEG